MCGICGIVRFTDRPIDPQLLTRACHLLHHRGPDDRGTFFDAARRVGFGATRLAVLDPSPAGRQPMHRAGGRYHLVYNGELYNFADIRRTLTGLGERFVTQGDTEVVAAACARWGVEALDRFDGMFALAFYDMQEQRGFIARDCFGIKPMLYAASDDELVFASELGALTALAAIDDSIDNDALAAHLQYGFIAHPRTIYQGAKRLAPGHYLEFNAARTGSPKRYYDPMRSAATDVRDYGAARAAVRTALADAVARRRVSDVPIGAFLSGGLDSSIIVAHLAEASGRRITTFSVGYEEADRYDESSYARLVADRFDTDHHELRLTRRDVLDAIPSILDHLGEPVGDSSIIPTTLISRVARAHVTVALSGDGGDELFGGYWRYLGHESLALYKRLPAPVRRLLIEPIVARLAVSKSSGLGDRARQFRKMLRGQSSDTIARHVAWTRILAPEAEGLFADSSLAAAIDARTIAAAPSDAEQLAGHDAMRRVFAFDVRHQLPADMLQKVDLASMSQLLEIRVPFLDRSVVELALGLPSEFKIRRGMRKRVLVDAYRGLVPDEVLDRPKQGFEVPIGEFLRGPLREMFFDVVTRDAVSSFGILNHDAVPHLFEEHLHRRADHADVLFALLSLCWWRRRSAPSRTA